RPWTYSSSCFDMHRWVSIASPISPAKSIAFVQLSLPVENWNESDASIGSPYSVSRHLASASYSSNANPGGLIIVEWQPSPRVPGPVKLSTSSRVVSVPSFVGSAGTIPGGGGRLVHSTLRLMNTPRLMGDVM